MLFPLLYSFFLADYFHISFRSALPSAPFFFFLPLSWFSRLFIFNRISNFIDLILYVFCLFFLYTLPDSFCAFTFQGFGICWVLPLLHLEAIFMSARFFLTAYVANVTLALALCLLGMHSAAASKWALTKFWYSLIVFKYVYRSSPVVDRICFLVLTYI